MRGYDTRLGGVSSARKEVLCACGSSDHHVCRHRSIVAQERDSLVRMRAMHARAETYFVVERAVYSVLFCKAYVSIRACMPLLQLEHTCPEDRCEMVGHGKCLSWSSRETSKLWPQQINTNKPVFVQSVRLREALNDLDASRSIRRAFNASQETKAVCIARTFSRATTCRDLQLSRSHISARSER